MALNPPPLKLYNCAQFALNNINKFAKGQGYTVSKFRLKTDKQTLQGPGPGVPAGAARGRQAEVAAAKLVRTLPRKLLRNSIDRKSVV